MADSLRGEITMDTAPADPRVRPVRRADGVVVEGATCTDCSFRTVTDVMRCPRCHGRVQAALFGPSGVVTASTCIRIAVPGHEPPYAMAYVVLDDGPRVLVHTGNDQALPPGSRVRLASDASGQLSAAAIGGMACGREES
jgi:uncharacterized OB-fold protein